MPYFFVDDAFADSKEVMSIPSRHRNAAIGLWTRCGAWSMSKLTDGFIPDSVVELFSGRGVSLADLLVDATLWERVNGGFAYRNWTRWQRTRYAIESYREFNREKQRRHRERKKDDSISEDAEIESERNQVSNQVSNPKPNLTPVPVPVPVPKEKDLKDLRNRSAAARPTPPPRFDDFWETYPRRRDRRKAEKAFTAALKRADPDTIIDGAVRYATDPNREDQFTKYAEGWLNGDGWLDEPLPPRHRNGAPIATSDLRVAQAQALKNTPNRLEIE